MDKDSLDFSLADMLHILLLVNTYEAIYHIIKMTIRIVHKYIMHVLLMQFSLLYMILICMHGPLIRYI